MRLEGDVALGGMLGSVLRKLDWMYERIELPDAQELARPVCEDRRELVLGTAG